MYLLEHCFEPLFELTAVLGASHHCAQVDLDQTFFLQHFRHITSYDTLRQPFNDRCFAHAGLAYQHRIVFRTAGKNLYDATDLLIAANDRIKLTLSRLLCEIPTILLQGGVSGLWVLARYSLVAADLCKCLKESLARYF